MAYDINLCATPCCGGIVRTLDWNNELHRYGEDGDRELAKAWALAELGYCPDCGEYLGDLNEKTLEAIGFQEAQCANGDVVQRARWDYNAAVDICAAKGA